MSQVTVADGQLATTATSILSGTTVGPVTLNISCQNVGGLSETVLLTFQRAGGTARRVVRSVLAANEQLVMTGFVMTNGDTLLGQTTDASSVDYLVSTGSSGPLEIQVLDANGALKLVNGTGLTSAVTVTSTSGNSLVVGANGATNPALQVDSSVASQATGIDIVGRAAGSGATISVISSGTNEDLLVAPKGTGGVKITSTGANSLTVGPNGSTNPAFTVDSSTASAATGVKVTAAAAAAGVAVQVVSSGAAEALTIDAKGAATITLGGAAASALGVNIGTSTSAAGTVLTVTSTSTSALTVGPSGATNPTLKVNANTASAATGISLTSAAAAAGMAVAVISSGTNENLTLDAKGSGTITLASVSTGNVVIGPTGKLIVAGTLTAGGLLTNAVQVATSGPLIYSGSGAPTISAAVKGSLYLRSDGSSTSTRAYIATDTAGTWTAITTAA